MASRRRSSPWFPRSLQLALAVLAVYAAPAHAFLLDVLTYNVAGLPEGISQSRPRTNHPQISPLLNAYDIVAVQEDFAYHPLLVASLTHPYQSIKDDTPGEAGEQLGFAFGDGLGSFSRLPFGAFERVTWNECFGLFTNGSDCLTPKGLSFQRHELAPGAWLDVYNWHADAGRSADDDAARASNTRQLYEEILARSAGNAVIVLGDTNSRYTEAGDVLPEMLAAAGLTDVWLELERGGVRPAIGPALRDCADPSSGGCERVDKIFYRSGATVLLEALDHEVLRSLFSDAAGAPLSDHDPVYARFEVRVVPEPGTLLLLGGGLGWLARRRRAHAGSI